MNRTPPRYEGFLPGLHAIDNFGQGGFRFAGMSHVGSLLALPSGMRAFDPPDPFRHDEALYEPVFAEAGAIDILLLGTGGVPFPVPPALRQRFREATISADVMTTSSAASTYNLLLGEGRRVAALLVEVR